MALKLGSLYVSLSADSGGLVTGLGNALKAVDKFSKEVKKASMELGQTGLAMAAIGGAAIKLASTVNGQAKRSLENFENSMRAAAVPVAEILVPAMDALARGIRQAATWIASLSPHTKAMVSAFAEWAVVVGAAGLALGRIAGVVGTLASVFSGLLTGLGALGLAGVAAIAAIAVAIPILYTAWTENWGGVQDYARAAWKTLSQWWNETVNDMAAGAAAYANQSVQAFGVVARAALIWARDIGSISAETFTALDQAVKRGLGMLKFNGSDIKSGLGQLWENAKAGAGKAKDWFFETWSKMFADLGLKFGDALKPAAAIAKSVAAGPIRSGALNTPPPGISTDPNQFEQLTQRNNWTQGQGNKDTALSASIRGGVQTAVSSAAELTKQAKAAAERVAKQIRESAKLFVGILTSNMGEVGSVISSAAQGAQTGGIWGAVIAAILELVTRTKGFSDFMDVANGTLQQVVGALSPLVEGIFKALSKLTAVGTSILLPLFDALQPLFDGLAEALDSFAPILSLVGVLFKALAPVIKTLATVIGAILKAFGPILQVLFGVIKGVLLVILNVVKAIVDVIDFFVETFAKIIDKIVELVTLGANKAGGDVIRDAFGTRAFSTSLGDGIKALEEASWESAQANANNATAAARAAGAQEDLADKSAKVAESFSNVPSGYKIALARFNAQTVGGGSSSGGGGPTDVAGYQDRTLGGGGGSGRSRGDTWQVGSITVVASDASELAKEVAEETRRYRARQSGNPERGP